MLYIVNEARINLLIEEERVCFWVSLSDERVGKFLI